MPPSTTPRSASRTPSNTPVKASALIAAEPRPSYSALYQAAPAERIRLIRQGVPAAELTRLGSDMGVSRERLLHTLRFSAASAKRRLVSGSALPQELSERMIGLQKLIGQAEVMVAESGNPQGFNAAHWVAQWLEQPQPALGGVKPADYMDTVEGQEMVASLLATLQSGAYA